MTLFTFYIIGIILSFPAAYYMNRYTDEEMPFIVVLLLSWTSWASVIGALGSITFTFLRTNNIYSKFNTSFIKGRL